MEQTSHRGHTSHPSGVSSQLLGSEAAAAAAANAATADATRDAVYPPVRS